MSTLESFEASVAKPDRWPMDDVWAYHDWHFMGNGDMHPFLAEMKLNLGRPPALKTSNAKRR